MAQPNGLNPQTESVGLNTGVIFYSGAGTSAATITALVGSYNLTCPSVYLSTTGSGTVWVLINTGTVSAPIKTFY